MIALLEQPPEKWPSIGREITLDLLDSLRKDLVGHIGRHSEPGENLEGWRSLRPEPSAKEERLNAQRDEPAREDKLGRDKFATVIANRLVEVRAEQERAVGDIDRAFFVHLDGPWGSGKSSILNFVKADLAERPQPWLIVDFNAWREQKNQPPWWALIVQIERQVRRQLKGWRKLWFWLPWGQWSLRNRWGPALLALVLIGVSFWLFRPEKGIGGWEGKDVVGLLAAFGAVVTVFRGMVFGSGFRAKALEELRDDPYAPIMGVIKKLIRRAKDPILVMIEDIDRCESAYVVGLLENIQTMLRAEPISYLVAGDRKWIAASFAARYEEFGGVLGTPGRPLGHLFLDKLFQMSVSVPRFGPERLVLYWHSLLQPDPQEQGADSAAKVAQARSILGDDVRPEKVQEKIDQAAHDPELQEELRGQAALAIASPAATRELESRYAAYGPLLDRNPRAMKRLINAIAINQAVLYLEGRAFDPDLLARWTILEMRWPQLAEALEANRCWLSADCDPEEKPVPPFDALLRNDDVELILNGIGQGGAIDSAALDRLLGELRPQSTTAK